jgi:chorismate dehydratase
LTELVIGGVPFGVGAPLLAGLDRAPGVRLVLEPPRRLVALLRAGALDAALVSSIEAFRRPGYLVAPGLAIACHGPVRSVRAFLRTPPADVRTAAVDSGSETSVALLRILLVRRHGARLERVVDLEPSLAPAGAGADVALLIGDAGLHADPGGLAVLDLGEEWSAWKGLPFVFALWLLRDEARAARVLPLLAAARRDALENGVADGTGGAVYYDFHEREREGLMEFRREAGLMGLCDAEVMPGFL